MRKSLKNLLLPFWLLIYLSVAQTTFGQFVLCFKTDGRITIEAGKCACHVDLTMASSVLEDQMETHHCEPCKDIAPTIDISKRASQKHQLYTPLPVISTHPIEQDTYIYPSSATPLQPILHHNILIHPSTQTAVLLI
jgi:hypothetical protein